MKFKPNVKSFAHQRKGVQWLWQKTQDNQPVGTVGEKGGGLFWDPGTGKTKGGYDFVSALYKFRGVRKVLVLCPINAIQVWDAQADTHIQEDITFTIAVPEGTIAEKASQVREVADSGETELMVLVLNYAAIIKRDKKWDIMRALEAYGADAVILDESHHVKNPTAKQSKAAHRLCERARYVLLLTGTPIGKNYLDLYSQLKAVDPEIWKVSWARTGKMNWTEFKGHYAIWGGRTGYELLKYMNLDDMENRYTPHIRSARKESIHDMPKVTDSVIPVEINASARRVYDIFKDEGLVVHKRHLIEAPIPLTKLLRLQQMTGGWVHDDTGESVEIQRDKLSVLSDLLADLASSGQNVLVFARFLREIEEIRDVLRKHFSWHGSIQGGVSGKQREAAISRFNNRGRSDRGSVSQGEGKSGKGSGKPNALVIQIGAAEALDGLQDNCSYGIFYSTDYSLIHWNQARGRLDRVGQKAPVTFYHLQVKSSVDSLILEALKGKKDIERIVMNHPEVLLG